MRNKGISGALVLISTYNEEAWIGSVIENFLSVAPDSLILLVNDGSRNRAAGATREAGVIDLSNLNFL